MLLSIEENRVLNIVLIVFIIVSVMFDCVFIIIPPFNKGNIYVVGGARFKRPRTP